MSHARSTRDEARRALRVRPRRGIWLFSYPDIKYTTRLQWRLYLIFGSLALILGSIAMTLLLREAKHGNFEFVSLLFAACAVLWGLLYVPAAVVYYLRRRRGEATDYFDFETSKHGP
jgi:hypothetical protein